MKKLLTVFIFTLCIHTTHAQHPIIQEFKRFYAEADTSCYVEKIQKGLDDYDRWYEDSIINTGVSFPFIPEYDPAHVDLHRERKVWAVAITAYDTESYSLTDDHIYDHLGIDSLYGMIVTCCNKRMRIKGRADVPEKGIYDQFDGGDPGMTARKTRKVQSRLLRNIIKEKPDVILFMTTFLPTYMYVKNDSIYVMGVDGTKHELNQYVQKCPFIECVREADRVRPTQREIRQGADPKYYRKTGRTPPELLRICQSR